MLVEGGYLHSMKRLIETVSETPEGRPTKRVSGFLPRWKMQTPLSVLRPLKRLAITLLGRSIQG